MRAMNVRVATWLAAGLVSGQAVFCADSDTTASLDSTYRVTIQPLLSRYCFDCHSQDSAKGGINFEKYSEVKNIQRDRQTWLKAWQLLHTRDMPPKNKAQPTEGERQNLADWIESTLNNLDCDEIKDPGRVVIRRLTRYEYRRSVRDIVAVDYEPSVDFPADEIGYGYDNIGDVLSLPPLLMEKYLDAAQHIAEQALTPAPSQGVHNESYELILGLGDSVPASKTAAARLILTRLAARAYRRPPREEEVGRLLGLFIESDQQGMGFEDAMKLPLAALLVSPHFLFRVEGLDDPQDSPPIIPVSQHELATRMSYFLWSSPPDATLLELAANGRLSDPVVRRRQVQRMLEDPRSSALAENFATQWLQIRRLFEATPDTSRFPSFTTQLQDAMYKEAVYYFDDLRLRDASILELLDSNFTFVNEVLAHHYGLDAVQGQEMRKVALPESVRGGVMTMGAVLTVTSNPTRTNPPRRGKWVLETILGTPPPPPVPDVGDLDATAPDESLTVRQRMELHRSDPNCAGCHRRMDPIGFGFENFDAVGAWRNHDGEHTVDASATLPDGRSFKGPAELKKLLLDRKEDFARALTEQMLTYALGRGLEYYDVCAVKQLTRSLVANDYRFSTLVAEIIESYPFLHRRTRSHPGDSP